jgi:NADH:ubiquinone oxidoreductase subunit F (NADH-binding)/NADH:ubiquinone oxidoreductase subunit E/NAD-dependent dihydropyrimidine dehydrogenase PreA subunit
MDIGIRDINGFVDRVIGRHGTSGDAVIPVLQDIQEEFNYLPEDVLKRVCEVSEITPSMITGVATFYSQFRQNPAGRHRIRVCTGTACHVKGALLVYEAFRRELKLGENEDTDVTGQFTIEKVSCLGCCTIAPVIRIDTITYGQVLPEKAKEILDDFLLNEGKQKDDKGGALNGKGPLEGEIRIGLGSCCVASGSSDVRSEVEKTIRQNRLNVNVKQVGCVGICNQVPLLEIVKPGEDPCYYAKIKPGDVKEAILDHFKPVGIYHRMSTGFTRLFERFMVDPGTTGLLRYSAAQSGTPVSEFLGLQVNIATENRGIVRPDDMEEYRSSGGFTALQKCLDGMTPQQVIDAITASGLRGRGGAGFPAGTKWQLVRNETGTGKFIICNGDEGDPGAFMDRMLLESYPFRIIEGMLIAGYATGADRGIFYIRAEYPLAVRRIRNALEKCAESGLTGKGILGSSFSFEIDLFEGAGAFVCGEETALIASLEGKRGHPQLRPPYPAKVGYKGKPTLINNTETFSVISWIIRNGAEKYAGIGTDSSKGTKVFALAGKVKRGGLIEVPMGMSIRRIVEEIGGGIAGDREFKAVQVGGPSGGCIPARFSDLPIDYEALKGAGAMMGSGGMVVLDDSDCMVDIAHYFLSFTQNQSCGKCTFCRVGTRRMLDILEKIRQGKGKPDDLEHLEKLANSVKKGSLCGLGKTAPNPVLSTLKYFRKEYEAHIQGKCPAGKCVPLIRYRIGEKCIGCTKCAQVCPSGAIEFKPYELHSIDPAKCIKCDICRQVCPEKVVIVE